MTTLLLLYKYSVIQITTYKYDVCVEHKYMIMYKNNILNINRVYAFWPFYGRFDGSPVSGAIASTVEITSSTQGTAGAPLRKTSI